MLVCTIAQVSADVSELRAYERTPGGGLSLLLIALGGIGWCHLLASVLHELAEPIQGLRGAEHVRGNQDWCGGRIGDNPAADGLFSHEQPSQTHIKCLREGGDGVDGEPGDSLAFLKTTNSPAI